MDIAMVITVAATMYITAWSLDSHNKMSGVTPSILAVIAAILLVMELIAYAVILLPRMPWTMSAAVFLAAATLSATCSLARANRRNKLLRDKSR